MAKLAESWPEDAELLAENIGSFDNWQIVQDQCRVGADGKPYALDLAAVVVVLGCLVVDDLEDELKKMKSLFYDTHKKE